MLALVAPSPSLLLLLAQRSQEEHAEMMRGILFWLGITAAVGVAIGLAGWIVYRRLMRQTAEASAGAQPAFTLADLKRLHAQGQLSDQEYERARAAMIARTRAATLAKSPESPAPPESPESAADASDSDEPPPDEPSSSPPKP